MLRMEEWISLKAQDLASLSNENVNVRAAISIYRDTSFSGGYNLRSRISTSIIYIYCLFEAQKPHS
jgi:hypothetical protein